MIIRMRHPIHGTKVAIAEEEAVADEANGWERIEVAALLKPLPDSEPMEVPVFIPDVEDIDSLRKQWAEKHGKPPHHKKGIATLKAELK